MPAIPRCLLVLAACLLVHGMAGESGRSPSKLDAMLADALAVIRINDPRWVDREIVKFAATLGVDPAPMRSELSKVLYHCLSTDGIDLTRPALLAWRTGAAPMVAIIPLANRRLFLDSFGVSLGDDAPLIRIGERDGTVLYSQNTNDGLVEYRLLVSDNAAFLARTTEECRALSEHSVTTLTGDAPLTFTAKAAFLATFSSDPTAMLPASFNPVLPNGVGRELGLTLWHELIGQLGGATLELRPEGENALRVAITMRSQADSQLGVWVGNQRNQPGRLLSLVRTPASWLTISGNILWQGQAERLGQIVGQQVKGGDGAGWTASVDELWRGVWALVDRTSSFAAAIDLEYKDGHGGSEWRYLADQQRAADLISVLNTFIQTLTGQAGEAVTAAAGTGFRHNLAQGEAPAGPPRPLIGLASGNQAVFVDSLTHDPLQVAGDILTKAGTVLAPDGAPSVLSIGIHLTPLLRALVQIAGGVAQAALPNVDVVMALRAMPMGQIAIESTLPMQTMAQLLRDSGIQQPPGK
jgi:hypothetical protein